MANQEQLDRLLKQDVQAWNKWRVENPSVHIDLSEADLRGIALFGANLSEADLSEANLSEADLMSVNFESATLKRVSLHDAALFNATLSGASLIGANLSRAFLRDAALISADLSGANLNRAFLSDAALFGATLSGTNLIGANLRDADLSEANLRDADLSNADLSNAILYDAVLFGVNLSKADLKCATLSGARLSDTVFGNVDLSATKGLESVWHLGPSSIGIDTIIRSQGKIPEVFLKGAGLPSSIIEQILSLVDSLEPIQYYSCFISYSSKDEAFAKRLYDDLHSNNVPCWFAPEDIDIGDKIRPRIEESIDRYDKLLLVLSEHSIASKWVAYEVERALNKEPEVLSNVLYPIRLDDAVMKSQARWVNDIRRTRHIGDFTHWSNHDDYQRAFNLLLRALKAEAQKM